MIEFITGVIFGIALVLGVLILLFTKFTDVKQPLNRFNDQFVPLQLPPELEKFLQSKVNSTPEPEPCLGLSSILHFLFQEYKDTRELRRWIHRRVQLELNDITTRSAAGRIIQDVKIRDLNIGSQIPVLKNIKIEKCITNKDGDGFEELSLIAEVDYKGGFQISIDTYLHLAGFAQLSFKLQHLSGRVRLMLCRNPYAHWAFSFSEMPQLDFKVDSHLQGRQLSYIVPLITSSIRRAITKKHVWPNYKIRNRPLFPHPLLKPSAQISAFEHIEVCGHGLEVTILQSSRLNVKLAKSEQTEIYCNVAVDKKPFIYNRNAGSQHIMTVLLTVKPHNGPFGLTFTRAVADLGMRVVKVSSVEASSPAEKCGFAVDDVLIAINSHPVRNERQVSKMLQNPGTEIVVLVERNLSSNGSSNNDKEEQDNLDAPKDDCLDDVSLGKPQRCHSSISESRTFDSLKQFTELNEPTLDSPIVSGSSVDVFEIRDSEFDDTDHDNPNRPTVSKLAAKSNSIRRIQSAAQLQQLPEEDVDEFQFNDGSETESLAACGSGSRRERLHARASEMFNASAAKMGELWKGRNKLSTSDCNSEFEYATEASENLSEHSPQKIPSLTTDDEGTKQHGSLRRSPTPSQQSNFDFNVPTNKKKLYSQSTKAVQIGPSVLWGQSLHYSLKKDETRYLNIAVLAKTKVDSDNMPETPSSEQNLKPALLGSVSIYIPQILADCQLTLSNCHREVFALRPPSNASASIDTELSKHAGFDPRLCYGDITIGFRHFPDGLPDGIFSADNDSIQLEAQNNVNLEENVPSSNGDNAAETGQHQWDLVSLKNASALCSFCGGKIWLKSASTCRICRVICHNKCVIKANKSKQCVDATAYDDANFEVLDESLIQQDYVHPECSTSKSAAKSDQHESAHKPGVRRRRIANHISNTLKIVGFKSKNENKPSGNNSTFRSLSVREVLEPAFLNSLNGSSFLDELYFEPGNAYNETIIHKVKSYGAKIFSDCDHQPTRKSLIDQEIDKIQEEINKATNLRRNIEVKAGDEFDTLDNRLQALALLMLHYCSGLQDSDDCMEKEMKLLEEVTDE